MDPQLKQRLVGAVSLLVIAVLVVPLVLDGPPPGSVYEKAPDVAPGNAQSTAPRPEPVAAPTFRPPPPPVKVSVGEGNGPALPTPVARPSVQAAKPQAPTAAKTTTQRWTVQVASFGKKPNATALVARLKKAGYDADIETLKRASGTLFRVRVGPVSDVGEAKRVRDAIKRRFKLNAIAVRERD
ncbi:MAG: SPOR domain-containing protein [Gammaproteobacteria bacterium]